MQNFNSCNIVIVVFLSLLSSFGIEASASDLGILRTLSYECISFKAKDSCELAFDYSERLQFDAASKENYFCQTRLLGLQSNFIMALINKPEREKTMQMLIEVEKAC